MKQIIYKKISSGDRDAFNSEVFFFFVKYDTISRSHTYDTTLEGFNVLIQCWAQAGINVTEIGMEDNW